MAVWHCWRCLVLFSGTVRASPVYAISTVWTHSTWLLRQNFGLANSLMAAWTEMGCFVDVFCMEVGCLHEGLTKSIHWFYDCW